MRRDCASRSSRGTAHASAPSHLSNAESRIEQAIRRSINWFLSAQSQDGYWWGELEADTTLESDYILYLHILGELKSSENIESWRSIFATGNCPMAAGIFFMADLQS